MMFEFLGTKYYEYFFIFEEVCVNIENVIYYFEIYELEFIRFVILNYFLVKFMS